MGLIYHRPAGENFSFCVQFSSVQFSSVQFSSVQFSSVQFSSVQFSSVQFSSVQFSSVQFHSQPSQSGSRSEENFSKTLCFFSLSSIQCRQYGHLAFQCTKAWARSHLFKSKETSQE